MSATFTTKASTMESRKARILVVDDHPIVRQGLSLLIDRQADLTVCGEAPDAPAALMLIAAKQPDIVILDISLEGPDGIDALKNIRLKYQKLPVLVLSMYDESLYAERALRAGANGYIMKQEATERVLEAIRGLLRGEVYVSKQIANRILRQRVGGLASTNRSRIDELTDRELEVFRLIGRGHGTRQVAEELHVSVKTVESYRARIKEKLSLANAQELVQHAVRWTNNQDLGP